MEDLNADETRFIFRPLTMYRQLKAPVVINPRRKRNILENEDGVNNIASEKSVAETDPSSANSPIENGLGLTNKTDLTAAESTIVFRPLFAYRQQQAARRRFQAEHQAANRRYYDNVSIICT